jgi:hypothetical protein
MLWRHGAVNYTSASETEDPGSNPARVHMFFESHSNAVVYDRLNRNCLIVCCKIEIKAWAQKYILNYFV